MKNHNIIFFSSIDWNQHRKIHHQLTDSFVNSGNRVLFIEKTGVRSPQIKDFNRILDRFRFRSKSAHGFVKLEEQLSNYNGRVNIDLLNWFQIEIDFGKVYGHSNEDAFNNTIIKWKKFYNEMSCGYINSGAQWKGAEFTFMNFKPNNAAHPNLFLRRVIKHSNILFRIKKQLN